MQEKEQLKKIAIIVAVVIAFLIISGCSLLSYFRKKDIDKTKLYKNKIEAASRQAGDLLNKGKFKDLAKKLNKQYYIPEDFTDKDSFATLITEAKAEINKADSKIKEAKTYAAKFAQTGTGKQYSGYIETKSKSIGNLEKVLDEEEKVLEQLEPALANFQKLFTYVDDLKKAQASNIMATRIYNARITEDSISKFFYSYLLTKKEAEEAAAAEEVAAEEATTTETSTETTTTTTTTDSTTSDTTDTSSDSGSSIEEIDPWVYEILQNKAKSKYFLDFLTKEQNQIDGLYTDIYEADKKVNFATSEAMFNAVEKVKNDLSDLVGSYGELYDNILEQRSKSRELNMLKARKSALQAVINTINEKLANIPSTVSSNSTEAEGYRETLNETEEKLEDCNGEISDLSEEINELEAAEAGRLTNNYENDSWRYGGALLNLMDLNANVSRNLMKDLRGWKEKRIDSYLDSRNYYLKLSDYQNKRASIEFEQTNKKLALL